MAGWGFTWQNKSTQGVMDEAGGHGRMDRSVAGWGTPPL